MNLKQQFISGVDNGSKYPSLEYLHPKKSYTLSINPTPIVELPLIHTYLRLIDDILPLFHGNVKGYTELGTKTQKVHYHLIIRWDNYLEIAQFYMNISDIKLKCTFEVDFLTELEQWYPYIVKQRMQMDSICHFMHIPNKIKYIYNRQESIQDSHAVQQKVKGKASGVVSEVRVSTQASLSTKRVPVNDLHPKKTRKLLKKIN